MRQMFALSRSPNCRRTLLNDGIFSFLQCLALYVQIRRFTQHIGPASVTQHRPYLCLILYTTLIQKSTATAYHLHGDQPTQRRLAPPFADNNFPLFHGHGTEATACLPSTSQNCSFPLIWSCRLNSPSSHLLYHILCLFKIHQESDRVIPYFRNCIRPWRSGPCMATRKEAARRRRRRRRVATRRTPS